MVIVMDTIRNQQNLYESNNMKFTKEELDIYYSVKSKLFYASRFHIEYYDGDTRVEIDKDLLDDTRTVEDVLLRLRLNEIIHVQKMESPKGTIFKMHPESERKQFEFDSQFDSGVLSND
jgi:hypothetical protein